MPARAESQYERTRRTIPADRFKIRAHLINLPEIRAESEEFVVGPGKRLFDEGSVPTNVGLKKTASTSNGVVMTIYRRKTC